MKHSCAKSSQLALMKALKCVFDRTKVKVKCSHYRNGVAQRVGRGIAAGQQHAPAALYPRERPGTHCTGGWVGPRTGLGRAENLVPTGIRSQTVHPVAQSLYRLSYPAHVYVSYLFILFIYLSAYQLTDSWHSVVGMLAGPRVGPSRNRLFAEV